MTAAPETKRVRIRRHSVGFFGFTLRQCFVDEGGSETFVQGLKKSKHDYVRETVIQTVLLRGPAEFAGLNVGDGVREVNGVSVRGKPLREISKLIKNSPEELELTVVPQVHVPVSQRSVDAKAPSCTSFLQRPSFSKKRQRNESNRLSIDPIAYEVSSPKGEGFFSFSDADVPTLHELKRSAVRPRASTPPLVSSPADPPSVAEQSSAR